MPEMNDLSSITKIFESIKPLANARVKVIVPVIALAIILVVFQFGRRTGDDDFKQFDRRFTSALERENDLHKRELDFILEKSRYREKVIIDSVKSRMEGDVTKLSRENVLKDQKVEFLKNQVNEKFHSEQTKVELRKLFQALIDSLTYSFNDVPRGLRFNSDLANERYQLMDNVLAQAISLARQLNIEQDYQEFFKECGRRYRKPVKNQIDH